MANKQTLPNMTDVQGSYVNTRQAPQMPSINYRSPLRDVAGVVEQAEGFAKTYTDLRYEQYEAEGTKLLADMAHEIEDSTDPCQLQDIKNAYDEKLKNIGGDDFFAKNYRNSQYFTKFKNRWDIDTERMYLQKMHSFEEIQAEATGQQIANAIATTSDPAAINGALQSYNAALSRVQHLSAEKKLNLLQGMLKTTLGNAVANNPDTAEAFINQYGEAWGKYGLNTTDTLEKVRTKRLQDYRLQKSIDAENRRLAREAKKEAEDNATNQAYDTALNYKFGDVSAEDVYAQAKELQNAGYSKAAFTLMNKAFPNSKTETQKNLVTANIGNRINNLSEIDDPEELKIEKESIENDIRKNRNLGLVSETQDKYWQSQLSAPTDKIDLSSVQDRAGKGLMTPADYNFLDMSVSNGDIKETQRTAIVRMDERNKNYAQYENQILDNEITTQEEINKLPVTDDEKAKLKGTLATHREKMGFGIPAVDSAYEAIDKRDYQSLMDNWDNIPPAKRESVEKSWKDAILRDQAQNYQALANQIPTGQLTKPELDLLYENKQINREQYNALVKDLNAQMIENVRNDASNIAKDILNGDIRTEEQLKARYNNVSPNTPYYLTNFKALKGLLKTETEPYRNVLNNAFKVVDNMMVRDQLGNNTPMAVQKAAETKNQLLYLFNQYMEKQNMDLEKMQEVLSPNNVAVLALGNQVTFSDFAQIYSNIGAEYDTEGMVNVLGNIDINNIPQLNSDDYLLQSAPEEQPKEEKKGETIGAKVKRYWNNLFGDETETPPQDTSAGLETDVDIETYVGNETLELEQF